MGCPSSLALRSPATKAMEAPQGHSNKRFLMVNIEVRQVRSAKDSRAKYELILQEHLGICNLVDNLRQHDSVQEYHVQHTYEILLVFGNYLKLH